MDQIKIKKLELFCHHGLFQEENVLGQKFIVSAILYTDTRKAGKSDRMEDSINYGEVCQNIKKWMEENTFHLLERAAEFVCERLLLTYPSLEKVSLEIEKPWAPVQLPLETVSVCIERQWHKAYLGIGSNMGDKEQYFKDAIERISREEDTEVVKTSTWIRTEPYGYLDQDDFLNGCLLIRTLKTPYELLDFLHVVEKEAGRERLIHWGPRTLDLDILFYDKLVLEEEDLIIPHKEIPKRMFVLKPLREIAPGFIHPVTCQSVEKMYELLDKVEK